MKSYDAKCPICGTVNHNLYLEETHGWMECEYCILKGMNYEKAATGRERNNQIGGHRSGTGESAHASIPKSETV